MFGSSGMRLIILGHICLRFIHQREQGRFHHVRSKTAAFQPRRDRDQNMQFSLLQFLHVPGGGGIGDDDLAAQVVGHVSADLQEVAGDDL